MKLYAYRVTDGRGNHRDVAAVHDEEIVCVGGLYDGDLDVDFEGKACHLAEWAGGNGLTVQSFEVNVDLDRTVARLRRVL